MPSDQTKRIYERALAEMEGGRLGRARSICLRALRDVEAAMRVWPARSDRHFRRLFGVVREYIDAIAKRRWNYRRGFGCCMCDYKRECRKWDGR
jgi:hypothetical protein